VRLASSTTRASNARDVKLTPVAIWCASAEIRPALSHLHTHQRPADHGSRRRPKPPMHSSRFCRSFTKTTLPSRTRRGCRRLPHRALLNDGLLEPLDHATERDDAVPSLKPLTWQSQQRVSLADAAHARMAFAAAPGAPHDGRPTAREIRGLPDGHSRLPRAIIRSSGTSGFRTVFARAIATHWKSRRNRSRPSASTQPSRATASLTKGSTPIASPLVVPIRSALASTPTHAVHQMTDAHWSCGN
jgi:hypothetical protein